MTVPEGRRSSFGAQRGNSGLLTILIVVLHEEVELEHLLENVFENDPADFEVIVVDGGSGPTTLAVLERWNDRIAHWISEPDKGVYDAMNKGAALATGHFLYHLNAGDRLVYLPIVELTKARKERLDVATFPVLVDHHRMFQPSRGIRLRFKNTLHHQGTFYRREVLPKYNLTYRILADFDANQRLLMAGVKMRCFSPVVAHHASGGICDMPGADEEYKKIVRSNYGELYVFGHWLLSEWSGIRIRNTRRLKKLVFGASR